MEPWSQQVVGKTFIIIPTWPPVTRVVLSSFWGLQLSEDFGGPKSPGVLAYQPALFPLRGAVSLAEVLTAQLRGQRSGFPEAAWALPGSCLGIVGKLSVVSSALGTLMLFSYSPPSSPVKTKTLLSPKILFS